MSLRAFIPAAGLGTRLQPLTRHLPKPLLPVLGRPLLEHVLGHVLDLPVERLGINLFHLGDKIRQWVQGTGYADWVDFFPEDPILGTGGALWNARDFLSKTPFLVYNGDVISDIDLVSFYDYHRRQGHLATLAVVQEGGYDHVGVDTQARLVSVGKEGAPARADRSVTFTGIALYEPDFLDYLPEGISHVTVAWLEAVKQGKSVGVYDATGCEWDDVGTLERYRQRIADELDLRGESRFISNDVFVPVDCRLEGSVVIESGCRIGLGVSLEEVVLLPDSVVEGGERLKQCLVLGKEKIPLHLRRQRKTKKTSLKASGSNRFYQETVLADDMPAIQLNSTLSDPDFERQLIFTQYFASLGQPVPRLLSSDRRRCRALFEHLGHTDLYNWYHAGQTADAVWMQYRAILDQLVGFQQMPSAGCELLSARRFDMGTLRWETRYFLDRFVKGYCNVFLEDEPALQVEFQRLAERVIEYPCFVMHRDCQSCNIFLHEGAPYFIDYQGARMGPPAYDAVSLIQDPYCPMEVEVEDALLEYYVTAFLRTGHYDLEMLRDSLIYCGLQRHMQVLGAYGFLTRVKGKTWFEQHIPHALLLLQRNILPVSDQYPILAELVKKLASK